MCYFQRVESTVAIHSVSSSQVLKKSWWRLRERDSSWQTTKENICWSCSPEPPPPWPGTGTCHVGPWCSSPASGSRRAEIQSRSAPALLPSRQSGSVETESPLSQLFCSAIRTLSPCSHQTCPTLVDSHDTLNGAMLDARGFYTGSIERSSRRSLFNQPSVGVGHVALIWAQSHLLIVAEPG